MRALQELPAHGLSMLVSPSASVGADMAVLGHSQPLLARTRPFVAGHIRSWPGYGYSPSPGQPLLLLSRSIQC